ncbi:HupE/UreJ family protein, partial [Corallococcus terminator]
MALMVLALLGPGVAHAHEAELISVRAVRDDASPDHVRETLTLSPETLRLLLPDLGARDGDAPGAPSFFEARRAELEARVWSRVPLFADEAPCILQSSGGAWDAERGVALHADFRCPPGALHQTFGVLDVLPRGYRVIRAGLGEGGAPAGAAFA